MSVCPLSPADTVVLSHEDDPPSTPEMVPRKPTAVLSPSISAYLADEFFDDIGQHMDMDNIFDSGIASGDITTLHAGEHIDKTTFEKMLEANAPKNAVVLPISFSETTIKPCGPEPLAWWGKDHIVLALFHRATAGHCTVLVISYLDDPDKARAFLYDPMGCAVFVEAVDALAYFMAVLMQAGISYGDVGIDTKPKPDQSDGKDCMLFCAEFVRLYLLSDAHDVPTLTHEAVRQAASSYLASVQA